MSTLKDQLVKLGFNPTEEPAEPAWGRTQGDRSQTGEKQGRRNKHQRGEHRKGSGKDKRDHAAVTYDIPSDPEERRRAISSLIKRARQPLPPAGSKRFYFQYREQVDFIEVDHESFKKLSNGQLNVTLDESGRLIVLTAEANRQLEALRSAR